MNKIFPLVLVIAVIAAVAFLMMTGKTPAAGGSQKPSGQQPPSSSPPAAPSPVQGGGTPPAAQSTYDYVTALYNMLSGTNPYCDYTKLTGITSVFTKGAEVETTEYTVAGGRISHENSGDITSFVKTAICGRTPINLAFALMYGDIDKAKATPVGSWMTAANPVGTEFAMKVSEGSAGGRKVITVETRTQVLSKDEVAAVYYEILADTMLVKKSVFATVPGSDLAISTGVDAYTASDPNKAVTEYSYR